MLWESYTRCPGAPVLVPRGALRPVEAGCYRVTVGFELNLPAFCATNASTGVISCSQGIAGTSIRVQSALLDQLHGERRIRAPRHG